MTIIHNKINENTIKFSIGKSNYIAYDDGRIIAQRGRGHLFNHINGNGYITFKHTTAHRIIAYLWGLLPSLDSPLEIDHINGNKTDNRVTNLQAINHRANCRKRGREDLKRFNYILDIYIDSPSKGRYHAYKLPTYNLAEGIEYCRQIGIRLTANRVTRACTPNGYDVLKGKIKGTDVRYEVHIRLDTTDKHTPNDRWRFESHDGYIDTTNYLDI